MASQKLTGRAASLARRRMQVNGKQGGAATASGPAESATSALTAAPAAPVASPETPAESQSSARSASRARRAAMAAHGKAGVRSGDRQRTAASVKRPAQPQPPAKSECGCGGECCGNKAAEPVAQEAPRREPASGAKPTLTPPPSAGKVVKKQRPVNQPTSRLVSRARRAALSSKGKTGLDAHRKGISSASLARQANPDISGRELARAVRERRSRNGAQGEVSNQPTRRQRSRTGGGRPVSGTQTGHSGKLTGDESGLCHGGITGTEYFGAEIFEEFCRDEPPKVPAKVSQTETAAGSRVTTGGRVGAGANLTGVERGSCHNVTGIEYLGREHFAQVCDTQPQPHTVKVSQSRTQRGTVVSGPSINRSQKVSGNERGTCKAVTGTPYAGFEDAQSFCAPDQREEAQRRAPQPPARGGHAISGIQPGLGGERTTGADEGACQTVSGTPYLAASELETACSAEPAQPGEADFPQALSTAASAEAAAPRPQRRTVTGSGYEGPGAITGAFSMGRGKVSGTEQFRFGDRSAVMTGIEPVDPAPDLNARVTGEGIDTGLRITGDDWDRGDRVTGTEGHSAVQRNPSRRGRTSAMPEVQPKREPQRERPSAPVTGSSGGSEGAAVTVSGGARG